MPAGAALVSVCEKNGLRRRRRRQPGGPVVYRPERDRARSRLARIVGHRQRDIDIEGAVRRQRQGVQLRGRLGLHIKRAVDNLVDIVIFRGGERRIGDCRARPRIVEQAGAGGDPGAGRREHGHIRGHGRRRLRGCGGRRRLRGRPGRQRERQRRRPQHPERLHFDCKPVEPHPSSPLQCGPVMRAWPSSALSRGRRLRPVICPLPNPPVAPIDPGGGSGGGAWGSTRT